ncbi:hypothetical protein SLS64_011391 [Diaporthe eres]|uniref:Uncharacterized protein n=1 Tax=Diaporthe eres TaxID=83184 RepID=A0ABR1NX73_DIAER
MQFMFSKIQEIKEKYDVIFQPEFLGAEVSEWTDDDSKLPDGPEPTEYFLRANTGPRYILEGILARPFMTTRQSAGQFAITSIESNGQAPGDLVRAGETVFIPAGKEISVSFVDRYVRFWSFASGDGLETLIAGAGEVFEGSVVPDQVASFDMDRVRRVAESLSINITL